ncbi:anion permease [Evansella sp. LMS18]|uniref:SLC13 family permease n=1 Tax=Evansella sp. LMS18 TaxID=2924033 RepID=UPI0020D01229|nr:SLC13 family permease [Evansella sp. LMS18]UTR11288.1 anion permease [Evansella sp. LMS18]
MTVEILLVLLVTGTMLICLIKEIARPDLIVFCALAVLFVSGILSPAEAVRGFSNEGMLTVAILFIVAGAVQQSGILTKMITKVIGTGKSPRFSILKMMLPVSGMSAFLNNTPIVVMFTPVIRNWCKERNISPSKFLIPLSYATIFGGTITLIGTSTNLIVHGLMLENGLKGYSMFQLAVIGVPAALIGVLYMCTIGYKLLPVRTSSDVLFENTREYLSELIVEKNSSISGKTIEKAGLRHLNGLYLIEIIRSDGERIAPVTSHHKIKDGDRLIFTGLISTIVELQNMRGVRVDPGSTIQLDDLKNGNQVLLEAVVSHQSGLINKTIRQNRFRSRYGGGVIAVHRNEKRINNKVGDIFLEPGDTLLVLAGKDFIKRWSSSKDFYIINPVDGPEVTDSFKTSVAVIVLAGMVLLAALEIMSMLKAATLAVLILFLTRTIGLDSAGKYMQFNVLLLIASSIGIGAAMESSGTASFIAGYIVSATEIFGVVGILILLYLVTNLFTEVITNNAAVVIMFPIALAAASITGADPLPFLVTITIAASASFSTPIGYQTNLIVYGPGGYRFTDYMKTGIALNIIYLLVTIFMCYFLWL